MSIKIDGLGKLEISLQKRTDTVVKAISKTMQVNAEKMKERIARNAPIDRGLVNKPTVEGETGGLKFDIFSGAAGYAHIMEFGSKGKYKGNGRDAIAAEFKGKPSGGTWPQMVKNIYGWLKRQGWPAEIKSEKAKQNYAKFIAGRIWKNGVAPANGGTGYFFKQYDRQLPVIIRSLQMAIKKFSQ
jgi:hypothetical protein